MTSLLCDFIMFLYYLSLYNIKFKDVFHCVIEGNYKSARQHFVHCYEGEKYARFLIEYHITAGFPGEIDLFVTQAVLQ